MPVPHTLRPLHLPLDHSRPATGPVPGMPRPGHETGRYAIKVTPEPDATGSASTHRADACRPHAGAARTGSAPTHAADTGAAQWPRPTAPPYARAPRPDCGPENGAPEH